MSINFQNYFIFLEDFVNFQDESSLKTQIHTPSHINNLYKIF